MAEISYNGLAGFLPDEERPVTVNPMVARQVAAARATARPNVTDIFGYGPDWQSYLYGLRSNLAAKVPQQGDTQEQARGKLYEMALNFAPIGMTGKPKIYDAYHGTKSEVPSFDLRKAGASDPGLFGRAVYLTPSPEQASSFAMSPHYGRGDAPNVMPLKVALKNPLVVKDGVLPDGRRLTELHPNGITPQSADAAKKWAVERGYDGVVFETGGEVVQIAAFDPKSVLSRFDGK